jgi:hypothetical protein
MPIEFPVSPATKVGTLIGWRLIAMPRYFFHVYHENAELDYAGEELPDKHAAWHEATVKAGRTLQASKGNSSQSGNGEWK